MHHRSCPTNPVWFCVVVAFATVLASVADAQVQTIEAEDYDRFFDLDDANNGGAYRTDGVDIEATTDVGGGFNVGWTDEGEWMEYDVVLATGLYEVRARVASLNGGGRYSISLDGTLIGSADVAATGGWQSWETQSLGQVLVGNGTHTVRVDTDLPGHNLNWIAFKPACPSPLRVEAEDYGAHADSDAGNNGDAYRADDVDIESTSDDGGGFNVGWTAADEWMEYDITLAAGVYDVSTRVASGFGSGDYTLSLDGDVIATDSVAATGGWQSWETRSLGRIAVVEGAHTLRVDTTDAGYNLNWIAFDPAAASTLRVEAEDYDDYFDTAAGNEGGAYRSDDVDIESTSDVGGGFNVGWAADGEWLAYDIVLPEGDYQVTTRVASQNGDAEYSVSLNGEFVGSDVVDATGGWQDWETRTIGVVTVETGGVVTLRVDSLGGEYNLNWITLTPALLAAELVWQDEFDGTSIDTSKWEHEVNGWGGGNNELQYYTDRSENSWVSDGRLIIEARDETYTGPDGTRDYTSARLRTLNKGDWLYGRVEVRAKLPAGQGLWPAIWMLPTDWVYGGWAASGEIDIMEAVNLEAGGGNRIHGTLHYGGEWPNNVHSGDSMVPDTSVVDNFHEYAIEWEPGEIRWYIDGEHYQTQTSWHSDNGSYPAPFDQPFHLILNVAVGGNWPGSPDSSTVFPQTMEVDYVRVYALPDPDAVDSDGDGVLDDMDQCPDTAAGVTVDSVGCAVPEDSDGDGVADEDDECPDTPAGATVDGVGCAVDVDADGDGVLDELDLCPDTPDGADVDGFGCPTTAHVEAEDYDDYFDNDPGNNGGAYRSDGVDIETTSDTGGGFNVGWMDRGEWMEYEIYLAAGSYEVTTRVATSNRSAEYTISLGGTEVDSRQFGDTGGWQDWVTHTVGVVEVEASGAITLRIDTDDAYYNLNWIALTPEPEAEPPPPPPPPSEEEVSAEGGILVGGLDSASPGHALYVWDVDLGSAGSSCNDDCATDWPPVLVTDGTASGVFDLGTITRDDGTTQATYDGRPLYFYAGDDAAGDTNGQGVGDAWWTVDYGSGTVDGEIVPLFAEANPDTQPLSFTDGDGHLVTRFGGRVRDRHAREDFFEAYQHFTPRYFENRTSGLRLSTARWMAAIA